ncbi:CRTAC1 family protein [Chthonomonas calidirosea]|nr:CRTAC1 family protein [Chthonomonas calidirosea]
MSSHAGLDYRWVIPGPRPLNILQTIGNGCAFLDFDNDGNLDILLVGSSLALYRGDGKGHFQNVTRQTGLDKLHGHFLGCAVGDYDNDGYVDIYLTAYRGGALLHNEGGSHFREVTAQSGIAPQPWGTSAAWVQTTNSGYLDLIIGNYAVFGPHVTPQLCTDRGVKTSCGPRYYKPEHCVFYANLGDGRFSNKTSFYHAQGSGRCLGVACADFDGSGRPSIVYSNDEIEGNLLYPAYQGKRWVYHDIGREAGVATDGMGNIHGGMGVDWGDYDNDGKLDLVVATFQHEEKCLYHNEGDHIFVDRSRNTGIADIARPYVAFGAKFFDFNNDGWLDLIFSNGHVQDNIHQIDPSTSYRQPCLLLQNSGGDPLLFSDVTPLAGSDLMRPIVGRGLAVGDYDNDGRVDLLIVDSEGCPLLLHNETEPVGNWLGIRLEGKRSNRSGYGALLVVEAGEKRLLRQCQAGGSYMSSSDPRVHFGLGNEREVRQLTVKWPSGRVDVFVDVPINRYLVISEGEQRFAVL